jgi:putative restriction endonuclease
LALEARIAALKRSKRGPAARTLALCFFNDSLRSMDEVREDSAQWRHLHHGLAQSPLVPDDPDAIARLAAFAKLDELTAEFGGSIPWKALEQGFTHPGGRMLFASAAEGIFKPAAFSTLLSIKTVVPKPRGGRIWYHDQAAGHIGPPQGAEVFDYAFTGDNPDNVRNRWLLDAMERRIPIIYFYGVAPGVYEPIYPVFIVDWNAQSLRCTVAAAPAWTGASIALPPSPAERRYAMREVRQRLHQAAFRERVLDAYGHRCALTELPVARLVDAAHIMPDGDEALGQPDVRNGICMSKVHHAAYDGDLIGIDPDFRIHVSERLFDLSDGPMLELGLKALRGSLLRLPTDVASRPDRDRLEIRFKKFQSAA